MNSRNITPASSTASFSPVTCLICAPPILPEISLNSLKRFACSSSESASWVQIAGDDDQLGAIFQPVDCGHRALECLGAQGIRRSVESDVRVAQLNERERRRGFAVELREGARDRLGPGAARERWENAVERADTERGSRDAQKRP